MASPWQISKNLRFGPYELDPATRELWGEGKKQVLPKQQFEVLALLIERQGHLVTREELIRRLWPDDTFVDFEQSLKKAVNRLRESLNDSADNPRFIETLPRQGYRFICDVELEAEPSAAKVPGNAVPASIPGPSAGDELCPHPAPPEPVKHSKRKAYWKLAGAISAIAIIAITVLGFTVWTALPDLTSADQLTNDGHPKESLVVKEDRILFVENDAGRRPLRAMPALGGEAADIPTGIDRQEILDVSKSGSLLLAGPGDKKLQTIWTVAPGGRARQVGDVLAHTACWTPDGAHVAFTRGSELYVAEADGTSPRSLVNLPGNILGQPHFSPDGQRLRFVVLHGGEGTRIWEAHADGSNPHPLWQKWNPSAYQCCGRWSPDGKFYYFQTYYEFQDGSLWVAPGQESKLPRVPKELTKGPLRFGSPQPGRDGATLFARGSLLRAELLRYDGATGSLVPYLNGISAVDVEVSRDGQWVTYVSYPEMTLWRSRRDGTDRKQLTFAPLAFLPRWSPDGQTIAFTQMTPGKPSRTLLISRDGGVPHEAAPMDSLNQIDVTWADDDTIYFGRTHLDAELFLFSVNLKTGLLSRVPGSEGLVGPRVSPDGKHLIALTQDWSRLMLYDVASPNWSELLNMSDGTLGYANWSHDGQYVIARISGSNRAVVKIAISDHTMKTVASLKDLEEPNPLWLGLAEDDSILVRRDRSVQEIYALHLRLP